MGKLSKEHINNRGYNKYLKLSGDVNITIDYQLFNELLLYCFQLLIRITNINDTYLHIFYVNDLL